MDVRGEQQFIFFTHSFSCCTFQRRPKCWVTQTVWRLALTKVSSEQGEQRQQEEENQAHKVAKNPSCSTTFIFNDQNPIIKYTNIQSSCDLLSLPLLSSLPCLSPRA